MPFDTTPDTTRSATPRNSGKPRAEESAQISRFCHPRTSCLPSLLCGLDPGLDDAAIVLEPGLDARLWISGLVDVDLHLVDLLLVERDGFDEFVGCGIVLGEVLVDYGGDLGRVVEATLEVSGVL